MLPTEADNLFQKKVQTLKTKALVGKIVLFYFFGSTHDMKVIFTKEFQ